MNHEMPLHNDEGPVAQTATPSAEFINAISEFFDTDPSDLLSELGYYSREADGRTEAALAESN